MRASGQPTLPVVGLQQLNDFAESYSAANLDLKVANTRRSQLAKLVAESSAQRSCEEDDAPPAPPPRTRSAPGSWRSSGLLPLHLHRRRSRGEANTSTDYLPPATAPCWHAFGGGRVLAAGAPRVPPAVHPSSPPPPGQHARVIGRVSVIPPNAAPSSMRLQVGTDLRRLSVHQLQLQCTAKTPLAGSPRHPCVTPRSHGPLLPRRHRAPQRPPTASCAMHCTPLVQDLQRHTHTAPAPPRPSVQNARAAPHE